MTSICWAGQNFLKYTSFFHFFRLQPLLIIPLKVVRRSPSRAPNPRLFFQRSLPHHFLRYLRLHSQLFLLMMPDLLTPPLHMGRVQPPHTLSFIFANSHELKLRQVSHDSQPHHVPSHSLTLLAQRLFNPLLCF